jgi:hypothetical protein
MTQVNTVNKAGNDSPATLDKAEVRRILSDILNDCTDMDTYRGLGELIDAIDAGDLDLVQSALLKHAPAAELVAELERRKFQVKSEDDLYNDWAEAREADE